MKFFIRFIILSVVLVACNNQLPLSLPQKDEANSTFFEALISEFSSLSCEQTSTSACTSQCSCDYSLSNSLVLAKVNDFCLNDYSNSISSNQYRNTCIVGVFYKNKLLQ